jgi:transposase
LLRVELTRSQLASERSVVAQPSGEVRLLAILAVRWADLEGPLRVDFVEEVACGDDALLIHFHSESGAHAMMGERRVIQEALFYGFSLERHVPNDHLLRKIDRFVDLSEVRTHLEPYYSEVGRPSIDPELMIRMLIVGYCFGVRSERRLCEEVHLNLAYRWFCRLGLEGEVPDHSTFSKNRHGRFRESDLLRKLFETVVARCMKERLVGGEAFAVDASMIVADAHRRRGVAKVEDLDPTSNRAVAEYFSVLDNAAFGGASPSEPKAISPVDPAARYTAAANTAAVYAYSDNYLVDLKHAVIMDVEATTAIRQAEVGAAKTMLDRTAEQFDLAPSRLWSLTPATARPRCWAGWWMSAASSRTLRCSTSPSDWMGLYRAVTSRSMPKETSMSALKAKS